LQKKNILKRGMKMGNDANQELILKIKELEEENARLRQGPKRAETVTCREGEYKGNPVLTFEGPFRPFSLGLKKLRVVKECGKQVETFLKKHEGEIVASRRQSFTGVDIDDGKI